MKRSSILFLITCTFIFTLPIVSSAQSQLDKIIDPLELWTSNNPQEKVHVHTDKPYYIAGDTIWLKTYVVTGKEHNPALSGAIYIDLLNETDSLITALKLPLMSGMAKGNIDLPDDLEQGNYRIRAYTQWMRNAGPDYFFDHTFPIGTISKKSSNSKVSFIYDADGKNVKVSSVINFQDANHKPLIGKQVNYSVHSSTALLQSGKAKTDDLGNITIPVKAPSDPDSVKTFIVSQIEIEKKSWEKHTFPVKATFSESDIQFFPESGDLVAGLPSRVAFKATGLDGLGLTIKGEVTNQNKEVVAEFSSSHAGMGMFHLSPEMGASYQATITFPDNSKKVLALPAVKSEGYVLSVYPQVKSDSLLVRILSSEGLYNPVSLIVQQDGEVLYAADFTIGRALTTLHIPTNDFRSGIAQLTLFNGEGLPENERIVFVEREDKTQVSVKLDQEKYSPRSPVTLTVNTVNTVPVEGSFSISVLDESQITLNEELESSIFSQLLLKSELKGYIEKPNYYFTNIDDEKREHLDILMLTQGYRRFTWDNLLKGNIPLPKYQPEGITTNISGRLLTLLGKPVENGKITLLSLAANVVLDTVTNEEGYFEFSNLLLTDSIKFTVQGRSAKNSDKVEILLDVVPGMVITPNKNTGDLSISIQDSLSSYLENSILKDESLSKLGLSSRVILLDEVTITGKKPSSLSQSYNLNPSGHADQVISANELTSCPTLRMCLEGRLQGVRFQSENTTIGPVNFPVSTRGGGKLLVVIDSRVLYANNEGDLMDIAGLFDQNMIDPSSLHNIEVLRAPSLTSVYGQAGQNGVILVNTKGWTPGQRTDYSIKVYSPKGFNNVREFYSPKYGVSNDSDIQADLRTTIYWNPTLITDKAGNGEISYFNAGKPASYRVVIEGISKDGKLARKVMHYQVSD